MKKQSRTLVDVASTGLLVWVLASSPAFAFSLISHDGVPARWEEGKNIEIQIDTDFTPYINRDGCDMDGICQSIYTTVKKSIDAWKNVSQTNINITDITTRSIPSTPKYDGKNQVKMYSKGWRDLPFNPPASALAVTISTYTNPNTIVDADIFFNAENFEWAVINTEAEYSQYDIENVLTHELGHFLGLDHTSENSSESESPYIDATMFFASRPGETFRRSLEEQDILGVRHLYHTQDLPKPEVEEISPNTIQIDSQTETIEILGSNFYPTSSVIIVRNNDLGDINARIIAVEDDRIKAKIPVSSLQSGTYEVVVANSYDKFVRLSAGLEIENPFIAGTYDQNERSSSSSGGCQSSNTSGIFLLLLPLLGMMSFRRLQLQVQGT